LKDAQHGSLLFPRDVRFYNVDCTYYRSVCSWNE